MLPLCRAVMFQPPHICDLHFSHPLLKPHFSHPEPKAPGPQIGPRYLSHSLHHSALLLWSFLPHLFWSKAFLLRWRHSSGGDNFIYTKLPFPEILAPYKVWQRRSTVHQMFIPLIAQLFPESCWPPGTLFPRLPDTPWSGVAMWMSSGQWDRDRNDKCYLKSGPWTPLLHELFLIQLTARETIPRVIWQTSTNLGSWMTSWNRATPCTCTYTPSQCG